MILSIIVEVFYSFVHTTKGVCSSKKMWFMFVEIFSFGYSQNHYFFEILAGKLSKAHYFI